jgi:hypothetical protein
MVHRGGKMHRLLISHRESRREVTWPVLLLTDA